MHFVTTTFPQLVKQCRLLCSKAPSPEQMRAKDSSGTPKSLDSPLPIRPHTQPPQPRKTTPRASKSVTAREREACTVPYYGWSYSNPRKCLRKTLMSFIPQQQHSAGTTYRAGSSKVRVSSPFNSDFPQNKKTSPAVGAAKSLLPADDQEPSLGERNM